MGHDDHLDRARHGRGHGYFRAGRRARPRPQDRRGHTRRGAARPRGDPRLSRRSWRTEGTGGMTAGATLPQLLRHNAESMPDRPALREKDLGIWQSYSWRRYWEEVRDLALGLAAVGFKPGDKLSVIGENRPRLYFAQLAAMSLGGIAVPVYQDAIATELAYVLDHAEISVVVAEDQEQVDKILSLKDRLPHLKLLVFDDPRGLLNYDDPLLKSFEAAQTEGRAFGAAHPGYVEAVVETAKPGDLCLFSYTSGTTSRPKGVMLSHGNLLDPAEAFAAAEGIRASDEHVAYLPMAWVGNSLFSLAL